MVKEVGFKNRSWFFRRDSAPVVVTIVSIGHFLSHVYQLALPPLFPFLATDLGLSNARLGLLISVLYVMMLIFQTPLGSLVDTIGAKKIFIAGILITGSGTMFAGFASVAESTRGAYFLLMCSMIVSGIGQSTFHPADYPLINAVSEGANQGKYFSYHMFAGFLGFAVAPALVGGLAITLTWETALISIGLIGIMYSAVAYTLLDSVYLNQIEADRQASNRKKRGIDGIIDDLREVLNRMILFGLLFYTIVSIAALGINSFTVVFIADGFDLSEGFGNTVLTAFMLTSSIGILIGGMLADKFSVWILTIFMLGLTTLSITIAIIGSITSPTVLLMIFAVTGFWYGTIIPARDQLVSIMSSPDTVGKSFGFVTSGIPIGGIVSPILIGYLTDFFDVIVGFAVVPLAFGISILVVTVWMWLAK